MMGVQMVTVARAEGVNKCSLPCPPGQIAIHPPKYMCNNVGWSSWTCPLAYLHETSPSSPNPTKLTFRTIHMDYLLGMPIEFFLHTDATVLTHWLKLAYIIMNWNVIGLVDVSLFWIYNVQ
jgi:hypothetical protein